MLDSSGKLHLPPHTTQEHLSTAGTAHDGPAPLISVSNQGNASQTCCQANLMEVFL